MKTSHDLSGLIKFLGRDDWQDRLQDVMGDHFGPAMEEFDLEYDEIGDLLGDHWTMTLWGCAFEASLRKPSIPADATSLTTISTGAAGRKVCKPKPI